MIETVAALAAFISVSSLLVWSAGGLGNRAEARVSRLGKAPLRTPLEAPFADRVFIPVVDGVVRAFVQLLPNKLVARCERQLISAGSPMRPQAFFTVVLICAVFFPFAAAFLLVRLGGNTDIFSWLIIVTLVAGGLVLPFLWLRRRVRNRKTAIWRRLPDAFDMITVSVEAGLGLDAALRQVATKLRGPLAEEIALTLRQVGMGRARREALDDMAYRIDVPEVTTFVNAIIQAETLGTSLGRVLRAQSLTIRVQRRQRAEEIARKAPVKMVFPLVVFIMPTFFVVTIGPLVVHLIGFMEN